MSDEKFTIHASREPSWAGDGPTECARTMEDLRPYRLCAPCGSDDTTLLAALTEAQSFIYEYVCHACGWFNWYAVGPHEKTRWTSEELHRGENRGATS